MSTTKTSLTVTFEAPFWIGLYERESDGAYEVCKITFGAEPKDYEVYEFLLRNCTASALVQNSKAARFPSGG